MSYLDKIAASIERQVPSEALPPDDTKLLFHLYALLALLKGRETTASDVHDAWSVWMLEINPDHPSIRPFSELTSHLQAYGEPFVHAIRVIAETLE